MTQRQACYAPALQVTPVTAVGAGDSFLGAMVWSLDAEETIEKAFCYGIAAGSAALLSAGTGLCRASPVSRPLMVVGSQALAASRCLTCRRDPTHALLMRHHRHEAPRGADCVILAGVPRDFRLDYGRHIRRSSTLIAPNRSR